MKRLLSIIVFYSLCAIKNEIVGLTVLSLLGIVGLGLLLKAFAERGY